MKQFKVYLSGPIAGLSFGESVAWTEIAERMLANYGISGYKPLRGKYDYFQSDTVFDNVSYKNILSTDRAIYTRDRYDVETCDALLVNLLHAQRVSIGTMYELAWASIWRKPIVMIADLENPESSFHAFHNHPFVRESVDFWTSSLEKGVDTIAAILLQ